MHTPIMSPKIEQSHSRHSPFSVGRILNTLALVFAALLIQRTVLQFQAETTSPTIAIKVAATRRRNDHNYNYNCVVDTCNDDWAAIAGPGDVNIDTGKCNSIRHALKMSSLKPKSNITGHWCKVYLANKRCESKRYRFMIFRDDDTKIDVPKVLDLMTNININITGTTDYALMASYRWRSKHLVTNWFVLDTHSEWACTVMQKWWKAAVRDHPEHDQKYFNQLVKCTNNNTNSNSNTVSSRFR